MSLTPMVMPSFMSRSLVLGAAALVVACGGSSEQPAVDATKASHQQQVLACGEEGNHVAALEHEPDAVTPVAGAGAGVAGASSGTF